MNALKFTADNLQGSFKSIGWAEANGKRYELEVIDGVKADVTWSLYLNSSSWGLSSLRPVVDEGQEFILSAILSDPDDGSERAITLNIKVEKFTARTRLVDENSEAFYLSSLDFYKRVLRRDEKGAEAKGAHGEEKWTMTVRECEATFFVNAA